MVAHLLPTSPPKGGARAKIVTALKLVMAVALVGGMLHYDVISVSALRDTFRNVPVALSAFAVLAVGYVLSALRWYVLLHALGIRLPLRPCAEIFAMGTFANTFLPGGTGGDIVRAVCIARHLHQDRAGGVISVLGDRVMGLFGVLFTAAILGAMLADHVVGSPLTRVFFILVVCTCVGAIVVSVAALVLITPARFARLRELVGVRTKLQRFALRMVETVVQLRVNPFALLLSFVLSVLITLTIAASVVLLSDGYGAGGLNALDFANAAVLSLVMNAAPVTPGGIGVAEGAFAFLCYAWETTPSTLPYGTIFFSQRLITTVISAFGSLAFVTYRGSVAQEAAAADDVTPEASRH